MHLAHDQLPDQLSEVIAALLPTAACLPACALPPVPNGVVVVTLCDTVCPLATLAMWRKKDSLKTRKWRKQRMGKVCALLYVRVCAPD